MVWTRSLTFPEPPTVVGVVQPQLGSGRTAFLSPDPSPDGFPDRPDIYWLKENNPMKTKPKTPVRDPVVRNRVQHLRKRGAKCGYGDQMKMVRRLK